MTLRKVLLALVLAYSAARAADRNFFRLEDVRPGLRGIGRTVFQGDRIEDFQVEILGIIQDFGPRQPIILARLSGGPLAETGILQGMSGSPVYIDGKLLGAVALGFPFSKEPIAGIQPIQSIIEGSSFAGPADRQDTPTPSVVPPGNLSGGLNSLLQIFSPPTMLSSKEHAQDGCGVERPAARASEFLSSLAARSRALCASNSSVSLSGEISEITNPLSMSGISSPTVTHIDAGPSRLGLGTMDEVHVSRAFSPQNPGQSSKLTNFNIADLKPGSMISVGLITGDWNVTADGTVTYIDGTKLYAFGHRFLNIGTAEMPFAYSDVLALVPNVNSSFKVSTPRIWVGSIVSDHATGIAGEIGRVAHTIPVEISVNSPSTGGHDYHLQIVNDRLMTPFLTQAALFSTLDATERSIGAGTLRVQGEVQFEGNLPPLRLHDIYVSDSGLTQQASADAVVTLAFVLGGGFRDLRVRSMHYSLDSIPAKRQLRLAQAWTSVHDVRPGETLEITAEMEGENGAEVTKIIPYHVPVGIGLGPLNITLSDASVVNFSDFAGIAQSEFRTAAALIAGVNQYRDSGSLYVRLWRQEPAFNVAGPLPGGELSDPPPSVVLVLTDTSSSTSSGATTVATRGSDVAQLSVPMGGYVISGAKTIQVEVKE